MKGTKFMISEISKSRDRIRDPTRDSIRDTIRDPIRDPVRDPIRDPIRDPSRDSILDPTRDLDEMKFSPEIICLRWNITSLSVSWNIITSSTYPSSLTRGPFLWGWEKLWIPRKWKQTVRWRRVRGKESQKSGKRWDWSWRWIATSCNWAAG